MRALIAGVSLAAIAVVGAPGLAGASLSGSAGGALGSPVTLTYDELGDGHARGTLTSRGEKVGCVVGVTSDKSAAEAIVRGDRPISDLEPAITRGGGVIWDHRGVGHWRMQSSFTINPDTSIYAVGQCPVQGGTASAMATYGGGPGSGSLDLGSLGS